VGNLVRDTLHGELRARLVRVQLAAAADPDWHSRQRGAREPDDVCVVIAGLDDLDRALATPASESTDGSHRGGMRKAADGKLDYLSRFLSGPSRPRTFAMEARDVNCESRRIEPPHELDHLAFSTARMKARQKQGYARSAVSRHGKGISASEVPP
jgi:hypothetical protein